MNRPALAPWWTVAAIALLVPQASSTSQALDWPQWRGPQQNGISSERGLPNAWSPNGDNLLWRNEQCGTRSTPIVLGDRLYTVCRAFPESTREGERVVCLNADTGELVWEAIHNVFLSDAPAERVGWSSVVGDTETGNVYVLGLGCYFQCLDGASGEELWSHSMSEEFGMLSTYGGRTNFPIVFENLVIISGVMTGWGEYAVPAHRFVAFDKRTGQAVWIASTRLRPEDTTYSTPVITRFNGQDAMVVGAGDGAVYAMQPRTGKVIWKYQASSRGINTTPLVADGIVYCGHSEQNAADTTVLGALFALDGRGQGDIAEEDLLWKIPSLTVGRCQPLLVDGRLYVVDDGGTLYVVEANTGRQVAKQKLGRIMFGSMVYGEGRIYVAEATGRWYILEPTPRGVQVVHQLRLNNEEILGSPIIARGRVYLPTSTAIYCIGQADRSSQAAADKAVVKSDSLDRGPAQNDAAIAQLQLVPVEVITQPQGRVSFVVRGYDTSGNFVQDVACQFTAEDGGHVDESGEFEADRTATPRAYVITAKLGDLTSTARVRVIPSLPWKFDFNDRQVPGTWVGAAYRHQPRELEGEPVLVKVSTIPKGTRSQSWMGPTDLHDYTIQADFRATEANEKMPDMGLINQRYTLAMNASQELQIRSWASRLELRFAKTMPFAWRAGTWYTMKFQSQNVDGKAVLRGKVWDRGDPEPDTWTIEAADATPNVQGSPGMFGNSSDAEFYIDNVAVYANP